MQIASGCGGAVMSGRALAGHRSPTFLLLRLLSFVSAPLRCHGWSGRVHWGLRSDQEERGVRASRYRNGQR
ncbi:hypothetical protein CHLRE_10g426616v5 [Chlamydomonas reinhardtii]|uniref:Secreted protein n=1 Tax=Chlamydomonas reinhardtii TaxID=3055 RepID=A0A2K3D9K2_CHLRE|nr:uncharacterized protein CHLRE_10g426616v5 [Chlamydomonas reinhardtii]PNW77204.1 hypothetical protein CHLRE_10g426616v5 [Chlamydomonas reinhardtii]